jgi:hypothetical protein
VVKASILSENGNTYVLVLSEGNIERLRKRMPIKVDLSELGGTGTVYIMWGATELDIVNELKAVGGDV